jgi:hypothetical protein
MIPSQAKVADLSLIKDQSPTWDLLINDTEPIFYYCPARDSCDKSQMVGAINPICEHLRLLTSSLT